VSSGGTGGTIVPSVWNNFARQALSHMIDPLEDILAPAVVERALSIYESFKDRPHVDIVQARKALTRRIFELIGSGETNDHQLTVSALAYLKELEREHHPVRRPCRRP
jgi:hypothetical protein